jgi:glucose dehydrogenase
LSPPAGVSAAAAAAQRRPCGRKHKAALTGARALVGGLLLATLGSAPAQDWPFHGGDPANRRYSSLAQIDTGNVATLVPAWRVETGIEASFQSTPIVVDGVMYVTTPFNDVLALDARDGRVLWRYERPRPAAPTCCGPANRGAAVADGRVYMATIDAHLVALDQATGALLWDVPLLDEAVGETESLARAAGIPEWQGAVQTGSTGASANMAPQVAGDLVLVGITGAGYGLHVEVQADGKPVVSVAGFAGDGQGLRGYLVAVDAATGAERWRWYSVPAQGWEGGWVTTTGAGDPLHRDLAQERAALARHADSWRVGGASVWTTPAVDHERGLVYLGTGNPAPQMDDATRPGDNLYSVSLVALELATGRLRWHYQQVPHDRWGYDVASPPVLFQLTVDGRVRDVVGQASKTGWFFVHDRETGALLSRSQAFVPQENLFQPPTVDGVRITPSAFGACSWSPVALDPAAGRVYIAATHQPATYHARTLPPSPGSPWTSYTMVQPVAEESWGLLTAIDLASGAIAWQTRTPQPLIGGVLATAGGLVFNGEGNGDFSAFAAASGERLWTWRADAGVNAPAITYRIDGVQYVAVAAGGNSLYGYPVGDDIIAFRLPQ